MVIVVTGFGLFRDYEVNASWEAVKGLPELWTDKDNNLIIEEIPVEYDYIQKQVPEKWEDKKPEFVVHVGVSSLAKKVTLELQAHNDGYDKPDVKSCFPQENCCLPCGSSVEKTCLDLDKICNNVNLTSEELSLGVEACLSEDAGRYLCDFSYYKSLHKMKGKSLFIHVPPIDQPYTTLQLSKTIKIVLQNIIQQIKP
jgi:pyroglutamyl-peptidase